MAYLQLAIRSFGITVSYREKLPSGPLVRVAHFLTLNSMGYGDKIWLWVIGFQRVMGFYW